MDRSRGVLKAEGVVLRKYFLRETSYILVVYTKDFGKIKGVMKGVRKPYPQFAGNFEIFTRCQLIFYKKNRRTLDLITQCEALDFFLPIRKDIERLTYANYFIELVDVVSDDYDVNEDLYQVLCESLKMLSTTSSAKRTARIFELKFLKALGMAPEFERCVLCTAQIDNQSSFLFSVRDGGLVCGMCVKKNGGTNLSISLGTIKFIRNIQRSPMVKTMGIKVSREVGKETEKILGRFMKYHIDRPVKSLKFLDDIQMAGVKL
ncbi:MAG: DNA repair protein RecO [Candidatus Omnitrophota bacterium]